MGAPGGVGLLLLACVARLLGLVLPLVVLGTSWRGFSAGRHRPSVGVGRAVARSGSRRKAHSGFEVMMIRGSGRGPRLGPWSPQYAADRMMGSSVCPGQARPAEPSIFRVARTAREACAPGIPAGWCWR